MQAGRRRRPRTDALAVLFWWSPFKGRAAAGGPAPGGQPGRQYLIMSCVITGRVRERRRAVQAGAGDGRAGMHEPRPKRGGSQSSRPTERAARSPCPQANEQQQKGRQRTMCCAAGTAGAPAVGYPDAVRVVLLGLLPLIIQLVMRVQILQPAAGTQQGRRPINALQALLRAACRAVAAAPTSCLDSAAFGHPGLNQGVGAGLKVKHYEDTTPAGG